MATEIERVNLAILKTLAESSEEQVRLRHHTTRLLSDLDLTFDSTDASNGQNRVVPFDPFPRVISSEEWRFLSEGIAQRIRVWNAFLKDIYSTQEALRAGIVPFSWVYGDPNYHRSVVGLRVPFETYVHVAAFDLEKDAAGEWVVVDDHISHTSGAVYALQSRRVLSQVCPEFFESLSISKIHDHSSDLLEQLRRHAQRGASGSRVALLAPGVGDLSYYEHSFLARLMGVPLVQGNDLLVLNSRLFLKTIGGLEPIDVLYRRIDEAEIDPLEFNTTSRIGVPGLLNCVRKGTVTLANAAGAGLADNRALASRMPQLARFYFNEKLEIPSSPRLICSDPDQCEQVLGELEHYRVSEPWDKGHQRDLLNSHSSDAELERWRAKLRSHPERLIAEPPLPMNRLAVCTHNGLSEHHAGLRLFGFGGDQTRLSPCALTRFAGDADSRNIAVGLGGGIKDTWVLSDPAESSQKAPIIVASSQRRLRLGSRIADHLFWMGRYAERAENITRLLLVLQAVQLETKSRPQRHGMAPFWEALARVMGHSARYFDKPTLHRRGTVFHYSLLEPKNPSSVFRCVESCRHNARLVRDAIPPEVLSWINRLWLLVSEAGLRRKERFHDHRDLTDIQEFEETILYHSDALSGVVVKNMVRNDGWNFWRMGTNVERSMLALKIMRQIFLKRSSEDGSEPERSEENLDALLAVFSCRYAYQSRYQTRPTLENAARLLLQDPQVPHSVLHCLQEVRQGLVGAFGERRGIDRDEDLKSPLRLCSQLMNTLEFADLSPYFVRNNSHRGPRLRTWLDRLGHDVSAVSSAISDYYLNHQAFNVIE